jgi:hypothetical protein
VLEYLEYWGIGGPCAYLVPALRERGRAGGRTLCERCACLVRARAGGRAGERPGGRGQAGRPCAYLVPVLCERFPGPCPGYMHGCTRGMVTGLNVNEGMGQGLNLNEFISTSTLQRDFSSES